MLGALGGQVAQRPGGPGLLRAGRGDPAVLVVRGAPVVLVVHEAVSVPLVVFVVHVVLVASAVPAASAVLVRGGAPVVFAGGVVHGVLVPLTAGGVLVVLAASRALVGGGARIPLAVLVTPAADRIVAAPGGPAALVAQQAALVGLEEDLDGAAARLGAGRDGVLGAVRARGPAGVRGAGGGVGRGHQSLTREM